MINFSIIIPHKNTHLLLNRCLDSIPQREDIEIIVVDDHSDDVEVVRKTVETNSRARLYDNEGYCAGGARNTGLKYAAGKWLLFADCDDYYVEGFLDVLDKYVDSDYDVLYFNFNQFLEGEREPVYEKVSNYIKECAEGKSDVDYVKYRNNTPWNKMIRTQFVRVNNIQFEEVPIANDMFFSFQIGYFCKNSLVLNEYLYNYIVYRKSQTKSNWNKNKILTFLENNQKYNGFVKFVNHKEWTHGIPFIIYQFYKLYGIGLVLKGLHFYIMNYKHIKNAEEKYPKLLLEISNKNESV